MLRCYDPTCVSNKHDMVLVLDQRVEEVRETCGLDGIDKHAVEVPGHVGELGHLVLPGHHAALGLVHIVVKHRALLGELEEGIRGRESDHEKVRGAEKIEWYNSFSPPIYQSILSAPAPARSSTR